jgi:hypothetical protein
MAEHRKLNTFPGGGEPTKGFKSAIHKISHDTFNTGKNKFAAQFLQSRKNVANYLQCTLAAEGYLVAEIMQMGKKQTIDLPPAIDKSAPDADDKKIIPGEEVKTIGKRRLKLEESLKKGYTTIYNQCLHKVKDKLEATND